MNAITRCLAPLQRELLGGAHNLWNSRSVSIISKKGMEYGYQIAPVVFTAIKIAVCFRVLVFLLAYVGQKVFQAMCKLCITSKPVKNDSGPKKDPLDSNTPLPEENPLHQHYFKLAERFSFYESLVEGYINLIDKEEWKGFEAQRFLCEELNGILQDLNSKEYAESQASHDSLQCNKEPIQVLKESMNNLKKQIESSLENKAAIGIKNVGNTCYINAALQPLIAIQHFQGLIPEEVPEEPQNTYKKRQAILKELKNFICAKQAKKSPEELGRLVGILRKTIFEVRLEEGGFISPEEERSFHDAGQFFELILHVLNRGFQLKISRVPLGEDENAISFREEDGSIITARVEEKSNGVFYLQLPAESLQDKVNQYRDPIQRTFDPGNEWRIENKNNEQLAISEYQETIKIIGDPPQVLVVRVDNHVVQPGDLIIDFASLFENSEENCSYKMVGFSQNHRQVHWTSVVCDGSKWQYCDDAAVRQVNPEDKAYQHPASYIVFEKQ